MLLWSWSSVLHWGFVDATKHYAMDQEGIYFQKVGGLMA